MAYTKVAALYDIHGNLPALDAVLAEVESVGVDSIVVGGDVLPGPMPNECLAALNAIQVPVHYIRGNGDRAVLAVRAEEEPEVPPRVRDVIDWVARQLSPDEDRFVRAWPATATIEIVGIGCVLFCHATPRNDTEVFTRRTADDKLLPVFENVHCPLAVCGHTHMQVDRVIGHVRVVNAGSIGMPFGQPGAHWLLLGPGVSHQRTSYDLAKAADRIRSTAYPQANEYADKSVLSPPSEEEMLELFSGVELR